MLMLVTWREKQNNQKKDDEVRDVIRDVNELKNEMREIKNLLVEMKNGRQKRSSRRYIKQTTI